MPGTCSARANPPVPWVQGRAGRGHSVAKIPVFSLLPLSLPSSGARQHLTFRDHVPQLWGVAAEKG